MPTTMRDLVFILPGISGSVLQKNGRDIWAPSGQAIFQALRSLGGSIRDLTLGGDDPEAEDLGDGVRATRVLTDVHLIPGLHKIDGYTGLLRLLRDDFGAITGDIDSDQPANCFAFHYDWRRDNRANARKLKRVVDRKLKLWREHSGAHDARAILLTHSMGGLVARYYTEVLEGWRDCRALFTFGTPHRGSLNAVNFLCNGYKALFLDLTETLRSFTSVHQLLPIYRAVEVNGEYKRVAEIPNLPGVSHAKAQDALQFHREIEAAVERHRSDPDYRDSFKTIPIVGTRQPTFQSAAFVGGKVTVVHSLPRWIEAPLEDGDGTVPRLSAIPIELSNEYRDTFLAERHSSLQNQAALLDDIRERIRQMQVRALEPVRGPEEEPERATQPAISLDLDDAYAAGESIELRARLINASGSPTLEAQLESIDSAAVRASYPFWPEDDAWRLSVPYLPAGLYRVTVGTRATGSNAPSPVHDVFEVVE
jgi:pimeloyl-ACP methyl ester carboxylesterase